MAPGPPVAHVCLSPSKPHSPEWLFAPMDVVEACMPTVCFVSELRAELSSYIVPTTLLQHDDWSGQIPSAACQKITTSCIISQEHGHINSPTSYGDITSVRQPSHPTAQSSDSRVTINMPHEVRCG